QAVVGEYVEQDAAGVEDDVRVAVPSHICQRDRPEARGESRPQRRPESVPGPEAAASVAKVDRRRVAIVVADHVRMAVHVDVPGREVDACGTGPRVLGHRGRAAWPQPHNLDPMLQAPAQYDL